MHVHVYTKGSAVTATRPSFVYLECCYCFDRDVRKWPEVTRFLYKMVININTSQTNLWLWQHSVYANKVVDTRGDRWEEGLIFFTTYLGDFNCRSLR